MRIIIKPLGMVCIAVVLGGAFAAVALRKPGGVALKTAGGNPSSAQNLISLTKWKFYTEKGAVGNMTTLSETVGGDTLTGMKIVTDQPGLQAWNVGISNALGVAFKSGEKLQLHFWGRSTSSSQITIIMQRNVPGFPDCFKRTIPLTAEWKEYRYEIVTTTMAQWESMIAIHSGFQAGTVELVGAELVHI